MENNKPRDFFLHVTTFTVLYFIAIALVTLLFTLIDYRFPDMLSGYYSDPYSGPVRFGIAALIILSPLFVYLMKRIQSETRRMPERANLGVRKWLTYITLFIAGFTALGDAITLLYSFLGGALAAPFMLKALTLFAVAGSAFAYFFLDLKGFWLERKEESNYAAIGFVTLILSSVVLGFYVMGSPATQRDLRLDEERRMHLEQIQSQVVTYWQNNEVLPVEIEKLNNPLQYFTLPTDPETGKSYTYATTSATSFELCATFARASSFERSGEYYPVMQGLKNADNWKHEAGNVCFAREIDTDLIKPVNAGTLPTKEIFLN
ncbi:MAG: hypothetical protein RLZZ234_107 [Candidatus Parcubacteria bacterium]|jgi:hypothetical protein